MQDRHKVRVCVSVVHLLADEIKNLGGTFGVYMYLVEKKVKHVKISHKYFRVKYNAGII